MKKRHSFLLILILSVILFISGIGFQARRLLTDPQIQESLVQRIQMITAGSLRFQSFRVEYFPQPRIILERLQLTFPENSRKLEADEMGFDFDIIPLLFGRSEPASLYIAGGKGEVPQPPFLSFLTLPELEGFSLKMGALRAGVPIPLQCVAGLAGKPEVLTIKGHFTAESAARWDWGKLSGRMTAELKSFDMAQDRGASLKTRKRPFAVKSGHVQALMEFKKNAGDVFLECEAMGEITGFIYEIVGEKTWTAAPMDASWKVKGAWNNDTEELKLYKASAKFPFGKVEANGNLKLRTGEIANFHMTGEDMVLEDLLTHWPGLENALPFHIGFSGPSQWALSGDGTLDHLSLHLNWDLTRALLTYAQYFSKAKDVPLDLGVDCLIQKGETLSGDFSIRFQDMSLKGNLSNLDVRTGHGQLNLITNKFNVDGWEKYIPLLQQDKIGGGLKFLGNWKGDLRKLEKAERIFNVTVEKGSWTTAEGLGLRQASFSLDYSPLMLEGRQMQFEAGDSTVTADLKISGSGDKAQAEWKLIAEEFKPGKAWQSIAALGQRRSAGTEGDFYAPVSDMMADFFPSEERLKKFAAEGRYRDKRWDISNLQFVGYNGQVSMKGTVQVKDQEPWYRCEGEIHGLDLGRFLGRHEANRKAVEGILTLKGSWEGKGWGQEAVSRSFSGQGDLSLINATCVNFDLREELATINPLSGISNVLPSMNHFDEVDLRWKLNAGKFTTDDLLMRHNDYVVDGEGTLGLDGLANFRMEVFLSSAVAARLLPGMAASLRAEPRAHLGPIPVLLSGPLTSPELKLDPAQVAGIRDKIIRGKTGEILVELVLQ